MKGLPEEPIDSESLLPSSYCCAVVERDGKRNEMEKQEGKRKEESVGSRDLASVFIIVNAFQ